MAPPTLEDIKAYEGYITLDDGMDYKELLRIETYMVKYGTSSSLALEAENMRYVAKHCPHVAIPKVHAFYQEQYTRKWPGEDETYTEHVYYLVSDFVEGKPLKTFMEELSDQPSTLEKALTQITGKLKSYMDDIRKISPEGYIGSLGQKPSEDILFRECEPDTGHAEPYGPFHSQRDMTKTLVHRLAVFQHPKVMAWLDELVPAVLGDDRPLVFTHNDLHGENIMVRNDNGEYDVSIIDWEMAGFYPDYWEYSNAAMAGLYQLDWFRVVDKFLEPYYAEHLVIHYLRYLNRKRPFSKHKVGPWLDEASSAPVRLRANLLGLFNDSVGPRPDEGTKLRRTDNVTGPE
ncbi:hypothetical protein K461DRAFT_274619 [Myriangium duriaei CBS 260.36]|uniref:Aminoglycoside phosphotransferase domain-containing protein n=1 Tax=Myriangium duriaei CBS 260.36 TaxID=1168546 RepID=A0A9P4MQH0_9PEZI|nr:hypothetical protein K461DRAFT_274619 [Myriangium duriaei CBS 260.36]